MATIHMMAQMFVFKCPKCGYIEQYSGQPQKGIPKCPKCGLTMQKQ